MTATAARQTPPARRPRCVVPLIASAALAVPAWASPLPPQRAGDANQPAGPRAQDAARNEGVMLTIYSTARPGAIPPEFYQPAMQPGGYAQPPAQLPGYAIIKQQRRMAIPEGRGQIRFTDVAALIEPTTVMFKSLTDPDGTTVLDQNFEFDLVSPEKLLDKFVDQRIGLTFVMPDGRLDEISGTLLSHAGGQMILDTNDPNGPVKLIQQNAARVNLPELPGGLITRPTLVWDLSSRQGGEQLVRVTYETKGMVWWADYNLVYADGQDANRGTIDLNAWVSIINRSGASYPGARLKLIAGDVQRVQPEPPGMRYNMRAAAMEARDEAAGFEEKAFFEYHLYTLGRPATLPDNSTKQIELFPAVTSVPVEKVFLYYGAPVSWGYGGAPNTGRELGIPMNTKVDVYLRFQNDKQSGMGMPLPSGRIRVNKLDPADETLEFIGEDTIDHTPKDEEVLVRLGSAFDVVGERRQTDFSVDTNRKTMTESFEIKLRNHKQSAVKVIVKENLYRWSGWEITQHSHEFEKQDARTIHFPVTVEADGEAVVTYTVRYQW